MPRNSRIRAISAATASLFSAITDYENSYNGQTSRVLTRLKALHDQATKHEPNADDIASVLAVGRAWTRLGGLDFQLIPLMIEAGEVQQGGLVNDKRALAILDKAKAALPHVAKAAALLNAYREGDDHIHANIYVKTLSELDRDLGYGVDMIKSKLEMTAPLGARAHAAGLRYLVTMIDVYGYDVYTSERVRSPDIAKLATLALNIIVTDKMVSSLRE